MVLPSWLLVVLVFLAVARLTRLVVEDAVLDRPRAWLQGRRPNGPLAYFVGCPWCVSIWLGAGVAAATYNWPDRWFVVVPLLALAASQATGLLVPLTYPEE